MSLFNHLIYSILISLSSSQTTICVWNSVGTRDHYNGEYTISTPDVSYNKPYWTKSSSTCPSSTYYMMYVNDQWGDWWMLDDYLHTSYINSHTYCERPTPSNPTLCSAGWFEWTNNNANPLATTVTDGSCPSLQCKKMKLTNSNHVKCNDIFTRDVSKENVFVNTATATYLYFNKYTFKWYCSATLGHEECDDDADITHFYVSSNNDGWNDVNIGQSFQRQLNNGYTATFECIGPTLAPTTDPTNGPTTDPTKNPTSAPTKNPSKNPTKNPTKHPTSPPTINPTKNPTKHPTSAPTKNPTKTPTIYPTKHPTKIPTNNPTKHPTSVPTKNPTKTPTNNPTYNPSLSPTTPFPTDSTSSPTPAPTDQPTIDPTNDPTKQPTNDPTSDPTADPTKHPTADPTMVPSRAPSKIPSMTPTTQKIVVIVDGNPTKSPENENIAIDDNTTQSPGDDNDVKNNAGNTNQGGNGFFDNMMMIYIIGGGLILVTLLTICMFFMYCRERKRDQNKTNGIPPKISVEMRTTKNSTNLGEFLAATTPNLTSINHTMGGLTTGNTTNGGMITLELKGGNNYDNTKDIGPVNEVLDRMGGRLQQQISKPNDMALYANVHSVSSLHSPVIHDEVKDNEEGDGTVCNGMGDEYSDDDDDQLYEVGLSRMVTAGGTSGDNDVHQMGKRGGSIDLNEDEDDEDMDENENENEDESVKDNHEDMYGKSGNNIITVGI